MINVCENCGSVPPAGARFCRACGEPLQATAVIEPGDTVSPMAQTVPLEDEGRTTSGLPTADVRPAAQVTQRVMRGDLEDLLKRTPSAAQLLETVTDAPLDVAAALATDQTSTVTSKPAPQPSGRRNWQIAAALMLLIAFGAAALAFFYSRRQKPTATPPDASSTMAGSGQQKLIDEQLRDAAALLAAGDTDGAIAILREAVKLDPTSAKAHYHLGLALEKSGDRRAAIEEYRAATAIDPNDSAAWRSLAEAQYAEGFYADAAESYRRIVSPLSNEEVSDDLRLEYADALRAAGMTEEARAMYTKVAASKSPALAQRASASLANIPATQSTSSASVPDNANAAAVPGTQPPSAPKSNAPVEKNRPPTPSDIERFYQEAMNIVRGRDVKSLQRAELLRALQLFMNVKSGPHTQEAQRYADRLGKEYDRRRHVN